MAESQVLKRLDFPAYCVRVLDNGLVAIAGGGGTSKTGVGNSIELGTVNYLTVKHADSNNYAQFQSIHTFEPQDAIMKFISFTVDRSLPTTTKLNSYKLKSKKTDTNESAKTSSGIHEELLKPSFDSTKSDLYIAACLNSTIEIYKVQPIIDKHSTNLTTRRTRTNSNSSSSSQSAQSNTRQRHNSSRRNSSTNNPHDGKQTHNKTASVSLIHQKSIHIDQIINENELSEPEQKTKSSKKLSQSLNTSKYDDETIDTVAVCQIKAMSRNNKAVSNRILLCSGTSKGNICIWEMIISQSQKSSKLNDSNNNSNNLISEMPIKCNKLKVFKEAHGKHDIDELQVNDGQNHLLSIGKDNRCFIWSLSPKVEKLMELKYVEILRDKNLRMKHARFAQDGNCLYTTYIPRMRGGGRDMSSYIHRWNTRNSNSYKVLKTHRVKNTILTSIQASKDGDCLCCGDYEGQIYLFDANFNRLVNFKKQHSSVVTDLAFYHDSTLAYNSNKLILSLSIDRTLQCYTYLDTNEQTKNLFNPTPMLTSITQLSQKTLNKLKLDSMNTFRAYLLICVCILLFCYFYTLFE